MEGFRILCVLAAVLSTVSSDLLPEDTAYEMIVEYSDYYPHPQLPYAYDALEPFIDAATLQVHHQGHHRAYCGKMNAALKEWREKVTYAMYTRPACLSHLVRTVGGAGLERSA